MTTISASHLTNMLEQIYLKAGVPEDEAKTVSFHQVEANLVGHDSHGAILTETYLDRIRLGHIVPGALFDLLDETPTTAVVDGHWGFGFVTSQRATDLAIVKARESGVATVTVRRQGHVGRLGAYSSRIAESGAIGIVTADSGRAPKSVAPYGGRERRLGTNPISIAVPSKSWGTIVLDMATSAVALGKLKVAISRSERIPDSWVIDAEGNPTTDPQAYFDGGSLLALGGEQAYKGYGLSFMVEIFSGLLTGIGFGIDPNGRHNDGVMISAISIDRFRDLEEFMGDVDDFVAYIKDTELAVGHEVILFPGEIEQRTRAGRSAHGIPLDSKTMDWLRARYAECQT